MLNADRARRTFTFDEDADDSQGQSMVEFDQIDFGVIGCVERVLLGDAVTH